MNSAHPKAAIPRVSLLLAWRNLTHDRARFVVTLVGIVFSVVLMGMQVGLLLNFVSTTSELARHSRADIFVCAPGVRTVDIPTPQDKRRRYQAWSVKGVAKAEDITVDFTGWKRPDGVTESVLLVGVEPDATMGLPWNIVGGKDPRKLLAFPDGVLIDKLYAQKLGVKRLGQQTEINEVRARVVGFTANIRTFTQSPYVFTSLDGARRITGLGGRHISYVLVKVRPGFDVESVCREIQARMPDTMVISAEDFAFRSATYWLFTTGAGVSLVMSAVLGLLIGGVIVAQTLYASTMDHLQEYATLRAIGGPARYLYRIVLAQAAIAGFIGYVMGIAIVSFIVWSSRNASAAPEMPAWLIAAIFASTLLDCLAAAAASLRVVMRIDPAKVFK